MEIFGHRSFLYVAKLHRRHNVISWQLFLRTRALVGGGCSEPRTLSVFGRQNLAGKSKIGNIGDTEVKRKKYPKKP